MTRSPERDHLGRSPADPSPPWPPMFSTPPIQSTSRASVRESYLRFPRWTQPVWTLLTGKPLPAERAPRPLGSTLRPMLTVLFLASAILLQLAMLSSRQVAVLSTGLALTPVFAVLVAGAWRKVQVVHAHHAVHGTLFQGQAANEFVARLLTTFALTQNAQDYRRDHLAHHGRRFTTLDDADAAILYRFGLRPGRSEQALRRALWGTLFSPRYHLWFLGARLRSNLRGAIPWRVAAACWMSLIFVGLPLCFGWVPVIVAVWFPLIVLYQMSALLQFLTEHLWLLEGGAPVGRTARAERCVGRFCGEPVPGAGASPASAPAWIGWWLRTLLIHVPVRLCIIVGDLPAHDWHHVCRKDQRHRGELALAIFAREQAIQSGEFAGMESRELWGIQEMVTHVLQAMARATPVGVDAGAVGIAAVASTHASEVRMQVVTRDSLATVTQVVVADETHDVGLVKVFASHPRLAEFVPGDAAFAASWVNLKGGDELAAHRHEEASMILVCEGVGQVFGDLEQDLRAGDAVLVPKGALHGFRGIGQGFWALSIQFGARALYQDASAPRVAFEAPAPSSEPALARLLDTNARLAANFRESKLLRALKAATMRRVDAQTALLDCLQTWSDGFQLLLHLRVALATDPDHARVAALHLSEELGHNTNLRTQRGGRGDGHWDATMCAAMDWFKHSMTVGSDLERTILMHLVLEGSGEIFHREAAHIFDRLPHFREHGNDDGRHVQLGIDLLRHAPASRLRAAHSTLEQGWAMITLLCDRMAEIALEVASVRPSLDPGASLERPHHLQ